MNATSPSNPTGPGIVFLHAHPDDEAIFTGGTIALLADRGHRVTVVVATSGELGLPADGHPDPLHDVRRTETEAACRHLGVHRLEFLGYRDSGMPGDPANHHPDAFFNVDTDAAAARLATIAAEERAGAIVVYDAGGIYGHPDHIQVHRVGVRAAALAGVPTVYEATVDIEYLHFVETHVVEGAGAAVPMPVGVGVPSVLITTMVDVRPVLERKRAAIEAHVSQVAGDTFLTTMPHASFADVYGFEWYVREGPPSAIDAMAG